MWRLSSRISERIRNNWRCLRRRPDRGRRNIREIYLCQSIQVERSVLYFQEQIKIINNRLKDTEAKSEYAEMNISKLHLRIDELEDEIIREKMKINA